jgi:hypothetical protein
VETKDVFGWAVTLEKAAVGCGFEKSSFEKAVVGWMEGCLVKVLWLLEKSPHFLVGPTCHAHIRSSSSSGHLRRCQGGYGCRREGLSRAG